MTNREKLEAELGELLGYRIAVEDGKPYKCAIVSCDQCDLQRAECGCIERFREWLDEEYDEPCSFKRGEFVEVSDDGNRWYIREFVMIDKKWAYQFVVRGEGVCETQHWKYCRKYGSALYEGGFEAEKERIKNESQV